MNTLNVACPKCHMPFIVEMEGSPNWNTRTECDHCHASVSVTRCQRELEKQETRKEETRRAAAALKQQAEAVARQKRAEAEERARQEAIRQHQQRFEAEERAQQEALNQQHDEANSPQANQGPTMRTDRTPPADGMDAPRYKGIKSIASFLYIIGALGIVGGILWVVVAVAVALDGGGGPVSFGALFGAAYGLFVIINGILVIGLSEMVSAFRDIAINSYLSAKSRP